MRTGKRSPLAAVPAALLILLALGGSGSVHAQVRGTLMLKADKRQMNGMLAWKGATKSYAITSIVPAGQQPVTMNVPLDQVLQVVVEKPAGLDEAVAAVRAGQYAVAVPSLEKIAQTYWMLQWAIPATRYLAEAYLNLGMAEKAVAACEKIIRDDPSAALVGDLAAIYWQALIKAGREATLMGILDKAVQEGSRELAARAQLARGDIQMKNGKFKEALVDGYLRTVVLYKAVKEAQPEALFKAAKCCEQVGDTVNAEKMRKRLMQEYPEDKYTKQLKSGA